MIDKERIIQLNREGKTCQEIRDELGYSLTTIRKYIKENGLKEKFNIETTLETSNGQYLIYIKKCSRKHFYNIVNKYFIPSMMYKIQNWNL